MCARQIYWYVMKRTYFIRQFINVRFVLLRSIYSKCVHSTFDGINKATAKLKSISAATNKVEFITISPVGSASRRKQQQ